VEPAQVFRAARAEMSQPGAARTAAVRRVRSHPFPGQDSNPPGKENTR